MDSATSEHQSIHHKSVNHSFIGLTYALYINRVINVLYENVSYKFVAIEFERIKRMLDILFQLICF